MLAVGNLGGALSTARPFAAELTVTGELSAKDPALAAQVKELTAPLAPPRLPACRRWWSCSPAFPAIGARHRHAARQRQSAPSPSQRMRQKTREPGAARATLSTSAMKSTANSRTPSS